MNQIQMVITATNQDIFTFLNRKCYLAVATDFQVVTAMRKTQTDRAAAVYDQWSC
ncbi:hypothetical protein MUTS15_53520 [Escherichia coli]|nr:hypothetical protein MUTS15_53520 [Escherichia coli]